MYVVREPINKSTFDDQEFLAQLTISDEELNKATFQGGVDEDGVVALVDGVDKDVEMLGGDANAFVMTFARYNAVIRSDKGMLEDGETQFLIPCKNHINGCTYGAPKRSTVDSHERKCTVTSPELAPAFKQAQKPIQCKDPGCSKRFDNQTQMTTHHWKVHQWVPKRCEMPGCTNDQVFQTRSPYEVHVRSHKVDSTWQNRRCPIEGCLTATVYDKKGVFELILRTPIRSFVVN